MDRRRFLATLPAAGALTFPRPAPGAAPAMLPIIDTHQHLWDLRTRKLSWLKPGDPLAQNFTPAEYAEATAGLNVVKSVYMEVGVDADDRVGEAEYVIGLCERGDTPMRAAVIGAKLAQPGFAEYVGRFKGSKFVKGVRDMLHTGDAPPGHCLTPEFVKGVRLLGELGMSFDLCVRPAELPDMAKLVGQCPDTRFILDHCGNPSVQFSADQWDRWRRDLADLARHPNVVCKVSGVAANGTKKGEWKAADLAPAARGTIDAFGWDRVMFGGDWPVVTRAATYRQWVEALNEILAGDSEANRRKLFHDNAARVYGI